MTTQSDRNPLDDYLDEREWAVVGEILKELPLDHPARLAYHLGTRTIALSRLVEDKHMAKRLTLAYLDGYNRLLRRHHP